MATIDMYNQAGEKAGNLELNKDIFERAVNEGLIHQMLVLQQSNARYNLASALTRAEVRGGGRKPFKQKGTGRARQGSIRAPHYKGGGVVFGPTGIENYSVQMPKKQRRAALFSLLSSKAQDQALFALESYTGEISTKSFGELIKKLPVERNVLFVLAERNEVIEKSARNIPTVKTVLASYLNVADLLKFRKICFVKGAEKKLEEVFLK